MLSPYDCVDVFEAPNNENTAKVSTLIRTDGRSHSEVWAATEWAKFKASAGYRTRAYAWKQTRWRLSLPNEEVAHEVQSIPRLRRREHETEAMKP